MREVGGARRMLGDWAMVATLVLTIIFHALYTENRLSRLEQKVEDLIIYLTKNSTR